MMVMGVVGLCIIKGSQKGNTWAQLSQEQALLGISLRGGMCACVI